MSKPIISDAAVFENGLLLEMRTDKELLLALGKFPFADEDEEHLHPAQQASRRIVELLALYEDLRRDYNELASQPSCDCWADDEEDD